MYKILRNTATRESNSSSLYLRFWEIEIVHVLRHTLHKISCYKQLLFVKPFSVLGNKRVNDECGLPSFLRLTCYLFIYLKIK